MKHKYDVFEKFADGSSLWRDSTLGYATTRFRLKELAQKSENRFYAIDLATGEKIVFSKNAVFPNSTHIRQISGETLRRQ